MKSIVLDIRKFNNFSIFFLLFGILVVSGQNKNERESRISASELPEKALNLISEQLENAKRVRYYQETDGDKKSYEIKFKKVKLNYSVEFDVNGELEDVEFIIKPIDIPEDSWTNINEYLNGNFKKSNIKKIQQQYPAENRNDQQTLKDAFQNLILPYINYEIVFVGKKEKGFLHYEALFNSEGEILTLRRFSPANYDHVLY